MKARCCMMAALALAAPGTSVWAADHIFDTGLEERAEGPYSDAEAARFLTQATFGPTLSEIRRLRDIGYNAWLAEQLAAPSTEHLPYLQAQQAQGLEVYQNSRQEAWWDRAITADDQLRQRVAFALSEILVISDQSGAIEGQPFGMANYYDLLLNQAFGNYRTLMYEMTVSPLMGHYLSMFKNRKPDAALNIRPDENYAREIMQLFSVGLVMLNPDGTVQTSGGDPIPTYDQYTIRGLAHVFTGWNWANCPRTQGGQWWEWEFCPIGPVPYPEPGWDVGWLLPMEPWESYHAVDDSKQLLDYPGVSLPNGVLPAGGLAVDNLNAALDNVFEHPNVGPFLARRLIQRLVSSNPTPAYVGRVAAAFNNNGSGVRGDLGAVVRAILMDPEARTLAPESSDRGKVREPLLRQTHLWRAFNAYANDGRYREWNPEFNLGQAALRSPTVFNFFLPDFQPAGELTDLNLVAPEFQIATDPQVASSSNALGAIAYWSWRGNPGQQAEDVVIDLGPELPFAQNPVVLVDRYDLLLMNRTMSDAMYNLLVNYIGSIDNDGNPNNTLPDEQRRERVQDAIWLIQTSPEYVVER
ncbi:MAG: DUF1800 domain-containing protein [Xanthomonadales bacterium]|nr:DUF1800 domain-containing protein [Xanthomonadales bacterium]